MKAFAPTGSGRLTKPKANDPPSKSSTPIRSPRDEDTPISILASYEDLKRPEARQQLRQQLTGTFPEAARKPSQESVSSINMHPKDRCARRGSTLEVGLNQSAKSSTSTLDSLQPKRLSAVPEKDNDNSTIDIEQAIALLQELKKTASPDDLVALHKALLPTRERESVISPRASTLEDHAVASSPLMRRRSVLPPGLATRGGISGDLLRKPGDSSGLAKPKATKPGSWFDHARSVSVTSLAALDLAEDAVNGIDTRAVTPSELSYSHTGAYKHGTLRVMNGAASPEPSISTIRSRDHAATLEEARSEEGYFSTLEGRPSLDAIRGRASLDIVRTHGSEESLSIRDRILKSDKAQQQRKQRAQRISTLSNTASRESLVAPAPLRLQTKISRRSFDRESVSPLSVDSSVPRFAQRWSHRASQISQEYVSDCELSAGPYDEKNALVNFASRLSTVYDSDPEDTDTGRGTPAAALSKLTGSAHAVSRAVESGSTRTSDEQMPTKPMDKGKRPVPLQKVDSGYESDVSFCNQQRNASREAVGKKHEEPSKQEIHEQNDAPLDDDSKSLYTFKELLMSPSLLSEMMPIPEDSTAVRTKSSTLLQLRNMNRTTLPLMAGEAAQGSSDTIPTVASTQSTATESKKSQNATKQKKLQKPIPKAIKEARRAEVRRQRALKAANSTEEVPQVQTETASSVVGPLLTKASTEVHLVPSAAGSTNTLPAVNSEPVELSGDTCFAAPSPVVSDNRRSSSRTRSKSRGRTRESSTHRSSAEVTSDSSKSWRVSRKGNRSGSRSRSNTPRRSSFSREVMSAIDQVGNDPVDSPEDDIIPAFSDFGSIARTLGSSAYDISTNQFKRATAPVPGAVQHQLQSPYQISTGLIKAQHSIGMDATAASELARMKSRDVAANSAAPAYDWPRTAVPKPRSASGPTRPEDWFRGWQGNGPAHNGPQQRQQGLDRRQSTYAESIPPLPELPADMDVIASKVDEMVAKKLKDGAYSTPASARNSADALEQRKADAMKKAIQAGHDSEAKTLVTERTLAVLHPTERPAVKRDISVSVRVRELSGSGSERSSDAEDAAHTQIVQSPSHEAEHPGWPGWEQQAKLWRERRESAGVTLGRPVDLENEETFTEADSPPPNNEPPKSPAIVVSRYITPLSSNIAARSNASNRPTDAAAQHASAYRSLLGENKENRPAKDNVLHTGSTVTTTTTTSTFVTLRTFDPRPAKEDVPRFDSAFSTKSYETYQSTVASSVDRSRSPGGRVRTPSGHFHPYSPSQAEEAERSRALSLAQLTGTANRSAPSLVDSTVSTKHQNKSTESLLDRYSGGLSYAWERGMGFAESAGTRHSGSSLAKRKSQVMSEEFGLDLSDVPIFVKQ